MLFSLPLSAARSPRIYSRTFSDSACSSVITCDKPSFQKPVDHTSQAELLGTGKMVIRQELESVNDCTVLDLCWEPNILATTWTNTPWQAQSWWYRCTNSHKEMFQNQVWLEWQKTSSCLNPNYWQQLINPCSFISIAWLQASSQQHLESIA